MSEQSNKDKVYESYDKIVDWYDAHRSRELFEKPYLDAVCDDIRRSSKKILDLGCGTGEPIARHFIEQGFAITGVDASVKMIELARQRFPEQRFIVDDMRTLELGETFDAILAWHSFFHLPPDDQRAMFKVFENHLHVGGVLLFTTGPSEGEVWSDNGGQNLYHASLSLAEYQYLLALHHFTVLTHKVADPDCGGATVWLVKYTHKPIHYADH
ncbi:methyltransferase [Legionella rubrilucens]|uniref:Methyltransferase n=1 Tax=Legionella rubrilucens TaxID=458 RepID=A0A0W0XXK6_9GAMM|nr:class I SAM-dependent methyltransferase [Legionella rubrilucens]KTD49022.1 methyltransferase [Legionella rubrilucens]